MRASGKVLALFLKLFRSRWCVIAMHDSNRLRRFGLYLWREWIRPTLVIAAIVLPFKSAIADWNWVPTGSMKPTVLEGDLVLVNKLAYDLKVPFTLQRLAAWGDPARGDIQDHKHVQHPERGGDGHEEIAREHRASTVAHEGALLR